MTRLSRAELSFNLDRALDWLELTGVHGFPPVQEARRQLLIAQSVLGFTRNEASPEFLAKLRKEPQRET